MRIGIVSDTHMPSKAKSLPAALLEGLQGVELILHAGDWISPEVPALFERIAPVESVAGNNDGADIVRRFGKHKVLELNGYKIGLIHGDAGPGRTTEEKAYHAFRDEAVDMIVFGHSHKPYAEMREGVLLFNPGSPTDKRFQPQFSFGIAELGDRIDARHIYYDSKL